MIEDALSDKSLSVQRHEACLPSCMVPIKYWHNTTLVPNSMIQYSLFLQIKNNYSNKI